MIQTATERIETAIKPGSVLEAYTQTKRAVICVACALRDIFFKNGIS